MTRLTKFEIEAHLLRGDELEWRDATRKKQKLRLSSATSRRLLRFLLDSTVRKPTELPADFVKGLSSTLKGASDPADDVPPQQTSDWKSAWRLESLETEGVGGVNVFGGPLFAYDFDGESWLAEGPNGSGKSSLLGAIIWAMTSIRPRDYVEMQADAVRPVYSLVTGDLVESQVGQWPPLAAFPTSPKELQLNPKVSVTLAFRDDDGNHAKVNRTLENGQVKGNRSQNFVVPPILIEAGLLMPARLASMKFGAGDSQLATSVQRLTGLDDLIAIGQLCEGLCNRGREYLSYKKKELSKFREDFNNALSEAETELKKIDRKLPDYKTEDTDDNEGDLAELGKELSETSAELTKVVSGDLASNLDLSQPANQQAVAAAIITAKQDVSEGIFALAYWKSLELILSEIDTDGLRRLEEAIGSARKSAAEALTIFEKTESDTRFQLKAVAAAWHASHVQGDFENCPLCTRLLENDKLKTELTALRSAGEIASRTFADNERAIMDALSTALPAKLRSLVIDDIEASPRTKLQSAVRVRFAENPKYSNKLAKFKSLVEAALDTAPELELTPAVGTGVEPRLEAIYDKIEFLERVIRLRSWFVEVKGDWTQWWNDLVSLHDVDPLNPGRDSAELEAVQENWMAHLNRLSDALAEAEPYRLGAAALRRAWKHGKDAREIEVELAVRQDVANAIEPLKSLGSLAESGARDTINGLSARMESILSRTLIADKVQFQTAKFSKKEGVSVRASVSENMLIDATLVANTSWIRAVLWAFIFALREEAVEQLGNDQFPVMVLDDPQATFDDQHRHRWSQQVASLQNGPGRVQVILATHDHNFLDLIRYSGVEGRSALLSAAGKDTGHVTIFDGELLEKLWTKAEQTKLDEDGRTYMSAARVQIETVLRIMLRGEEASVNAMGDGFALGKCREKLEWLSNKGKPPWDKHAISSLLRALRKDITVIKHLEMSHHASSSHLGMAEATDVRAYLEKTLLPALKEAFKTQREHFRLHGGLTRLHASANVRALPNGYPDEVRQIPLKILGRAAALTDGKYADGRIEMDDYDEAASKRIVLAQHAAYRLLASTLEPVATFGDILIVKNDGKATPNSFVVASTEDKLFARRLEFAENHSDVAVLIAQANNPRKIAAPVIAQQSTFELRKVVGVIYDSRHLVSDSSGNEVGEIGGVSALSHLLSGKLGLLEIVGDSAEPIALHGQYIIVTDPLPINSTFTALAGKPVIVEDVRGHRYFKRLQTTNQGRIVLESLDSSGEHGPIIMNPGDDDGADENVIVRVWPVAGILFEKPV
ncbi:hypothetical protein [Ensifer aridi]|uniref:hypothetical protein n=1 Tax=Ensifer aridi TaxID=1708715 RepID=UPI000A10B6F3|nr:hypothetical protein [Ensifer aridi]